MISILLVALAAVVIIWLTPQPANAIWQALLDEHFEEDQRNPVLQWPWYTDQRGGNRRRWMWNPRSPHFRTVPSPPYRQTDYCWGLQNYVYNRFVRRDDDQSLWCAYTNRNRVNEPRWPEDDDYENNQNAWVFWGPIDLSEAAGAAVSFWYIIDMDNFTGDSLTAVVCNSASPAQITADNDAFHENVAWGFSRKHRTDDWRIAQFSLDTLRLDGDTVSYIGEEEVYIGFVWHSNNRAHPGMGAFIDDVIFQWDDGLFDLYPVRQKFGYQVDEDSVSWTHENPRFGDEVMFGFEWDVEGIGETPEFTIECYLNEELIYSEDRVGIGNTDTVFVSIADTVWTVTEDDHLLQWFLDVPYDEGGVVEETHEANNRSNRQFSAIWNPAPMFELTSPEELVQIGIDEMAEISWTISDSNDFDEYFTIFLYATTDTSGLSEDIENIFNFTMIASVYEARPGEGSAQWDIPEYYRLEFIDIGETYYILGVAVDSDPVNLVVDVAAGRVEIMPPASVDEKAPAASEYSLSKPYPNPFNNRITLGYNLPASDQVKLSAFDLAGREVAVLADGSRAAGQHTLSWSPESLSAGVYMLRLETSYGVFHQKAVYMP